MEVEIENHSTEPRSLRDRASEKLSALWSSDGDNSSSVDDAKSKRKKWVPKAQREETQQEFSTLVSSVLVLSLAFSPLPDEVKPNDDELSGVSLRISRIILRHVDISGKLTGDALDVIGIFAISSSWYARVAPALKQIREQKSHTAPEVRSSVFQQKSDDVTQDANEWTTPIEAANPTLKEWLDNAAESENG